MVREIDGGSAHRELKQRKGRAGVAEHKIEQVLTGPKFGKGFNYEALPGEWKELVDWLFEADFGTDTEHQGLTIEEMTIALSRGHLPHGMEMEDCIEWIRSLKKKLEVEQ